jgi:predicted DNA-binding transcriptional regulator YafY
MLTEPNCKVGTEHLLGILHAIRNSYVIRFHYQKYYEDAPTSQSVSPLGLKESEGRWYLVARDSKKVIKVFGLDRISELEITTTPFAYPKEFDLAEYFQHSYGATRPDHLEPQDIVLSFKPLQGKYLKTFPLHQSQKILIDNSKELQISIRVYITLDLIMKLWSYGKMLTVVSPPTLLQMDI